MFVQKQVKKLFVEQAVERVKHLRVGNPLLNDTQLGAVISLQHRDKVVSYVDSARKEVCFAIKQFK